MKRAAALLAVACLLPQAARADTFDRYINTVLEKVPEAKQALKVKQLTPEQIAERAGAVGDLSGTFLVVKTNEGRFARLLVQPARQKIVGGSVPILLIERYVTYREGEDRHVQARGQGVRLFGGFQFNLDMGQVVPEKVGGDLRFVAGEKTYLEPVGKAELYVLTAPLPEAAAKKAEKVAVGAAFETRLFNGVYHLFDDGRRSGKLHLKVDQAGDVLGHYYSDKDGQKYEVTGKAGGPAHRIEFRVTFPRTVQFFQGHMFTGDARAIAGTSRLEERETGFYAVRVPE